MNARAAAPHDEKHEQREEAQQQNGSRQSQLRSAFSLISLYY
jgi:hypothetical protein